MSRSFDRDLRRLAQLHGLQLAYKDVTGRRRTASVDSLQATLRVLGIPVENADDLAAAFAEHRRGEADRVLPPVIVAWDGRTTEIDLLVAPERGHDRIIVHVQLENGEQQRTETRISELPALSPERIPSVEISDGRSLRLPKLPIGYHRVTLEAPWGTRESLLIAAPRQAWPPRPLRKQGNAGNELGSPSPLREPGTRESPLRTWGCFLPLYALRSHSNWGAGTYTDLTELARWITDLGGSVIGTLPLLPTVLDEPCDPSPYSPVSRLAWNEFYIDVASIPELQDCPEAQALIQTDTARREIQSLREGALVEYRRLMALKRSVLEKLAHWFFATQPRRFGEFQKFVDDQPSIADYARFRATWDRQRSPWTEWPERLRDGQLAENDFDEDARRYYLFAQWIAAEQMNALAAETRSKGAMLYLDLPLGTRRDGYDVWRHRAEYATRATAGAPPDAVFIHGQDWGFSPLHPETIRERHYEHVRAYLRHHLRYARLLRMDHVMMLHRLYWIPDGLPPSEGVYVRYHADELYALLSVESHRHQALLVGENLGTVPAEVNRSLSRHAIRTMHVVQYECESAPDGSPGDVPATSVASLNTHDMPAFGAWCAGEDIPLRRELGLLDEAGAAEERRTRERQKASILKQLWDHGRLPAAGHAPPPRKQGSDDLSDNSSPPRKQGSDASIALASQPAPLEVTSACLADLAASPAEVVLVNLEDLWDERRPQNVPGTGDERPNWRRKAVHTLEDMRDMAEVTSVLKSIQQLRSRTTDVGGQ